jgi:hypothetical protein
MKIRSGFVSNSSSSSFVIFRDAIPNNQLDMILNIDHWVKIFIEKDKENGGVDNLEDKFSYYDSDPWRIVVYDDFIFGETSMDNFSMDEYLNYLKIDNKYICWDEGYTDEPYQNQLKFIKKMKQKYRKKKIDKINNTDNEL